MLRMQKYFLVIPVVIAAVAGTAAAEQLVPIKIKDGSIDQPLTAQAGNPANGAATIADRKLGNCLACHQVTKLKAEPFHGDVGPALDGVASRWNEGQLRMIVVDPKKVFDDTAMPSFYRTEGMHRVRKEFQDKPMLTAQQVEDVVAFLKTLKE